MSKRFNIGDLFRKVPGAGFVGESLPLCRVNDSPEQPCFYCDDPDCREWANCSVLDEGGNVLGPLYHVSECQMQPPVGHVRKR